MDDGRRALITGIEGQDGSYLAELLLDRGYDVWGTARGNPEAERPNLSAVRDRITVLACDLRDRTALPAAIDRCRPTELYNLAATTLVPGSTSDPGANVAPNATPVKAIPVTAMLEAVRRDHPATRRYQSCPAQVVPVPAMADQSETTPLRPVNPY